MPSGVVNAKLEATVRLPVRDDSGREHEIEGIIDTGFNGSLTLSPTIIRDLGLSWRSRGSAVLANGAVDQFDIYSASIVWDGLPRNVLVEEVNTEPLIGMALLQGHDLSIRVVRGGGVTITAVP